MYASDYRAIAREKLTGNWGVAVLVCFLASVMGGSIVASGFSIDIDAESMEQLQSLSPMVQKLFQTWLSVGSGLGLVRFVIGGPITLGNCRYHLNQHDGAKHEVANLFAGFNRWGEGFLLSLLESLFVVLWSLLFVIPGIIAAYRYSMAFFIMEENPEMSAKEALSASTALMNGHKWELFCLDISFIGWALLSALTLGIGDLFLCPYRSASRAAFYRNLVPQNAASADEPRQLPTVEF